MKDSQSPLPTGKLLPPPLHGGPASGAIAAAEGRRLLRALERDCRYAFQPIVGIHSGAASGFEALLRGCDAVGASSVPALFDRLSDLGVLHRAELVLREKAVTAFRTFAAGSGARLFLNLDPRVLDSPDYRPQRTRDLIDRHGLEPSALCFELSESQALGTGGSPSRILDLYRRQGYRLALDDFGTGHSGLKLLYDRQPDLVKIDRYFISGIDADAKKRMMVSSVVQMAKVLGIAIIAEGVETERELMVCKEIGCDLVQGWVVARPTLTPEIPAGGFATVVEINRRDRRRPGGDGPLVREEIVAVPAIRVDATMPDVFEVFRRNKDRNFFPVTDASRRPIGIIREHDLKDFIYSRYGRDLLSNRASSKRLIDFVSRCPVCEIDTPVEGILATFTAAGDPAGVIMVDRHRYAGVLDAGSLLRLIQEKRLAQARDQNPLSRLPGNASIVDWVAGALEAEAPSTLVYFDLDNFKPFNDIYGFRQGDRVILLFAELMRRTFGAGDAFLGHVGGDDFFAGFPLRRPPAVIAAVAELLRVFASDAESFYDADARARRHIVARDREGREQEFPLITASAAVLGLPDGASRLTAEQVGRRIAALKRSAKAAPDRIAIASETDGPLRSP